MDLERASHIALGLGQEFLTWLWFASERGNGVFYGPKGEAFRLTVEQRVRVCGGEGEGRETAVCSGPMASLQEARTGLAAGKKVDSLRLRLEHADNVWTLAWDAATLSPASLKTPKVEMRLEEGEDPDGRFFEKIFLVEQALDFVHAVFARFVAVRFSDQWTEEVREMEAWIGRRGRFSDG